HHDRGLVHPDEDVDVDEDLTRRLNRSRAKLLASTHDPHARQITDLADSVGLADLEAWANHATAAEQQATIAIGSTPARLQALIDRAEHTATHVAVGQTIKAHDRHIIGTVIGLDDDHGRVLVQFVAASGHSAERLLPWEQIEILDRH